MSRQTFATKNKPSPKSAARSSKPAASGKQLAQPLPRSIQNLPIQAKLTIGQPNDKYEQEADWVADQVMRMSDADVAQRVESGTVQPMRIQRMCPECEEELHRQPEDEEEEGMLQAKEIPGKTPAVAQNIESRINSLKSGGQPLDLSTRAFFEPRFGLDFRSVYLHKESAAADIAESIYARAFTFGNHVVMNSGEYNPESIEGRRLLGHELVHVVQQRANTQISEELDQTSQCSVNKSIIQLHRRRQPVARLVGMETDRRVLLLLRRLRRRLRRFRPAARNASLGRIIANELHMNGNTIQLRMTNVNSSGTTDSERERTFSARLGIGAFYLNPIPRSQAGILVLTPGGAYEILSVARNGRLRETNFVTVTPNLPVRPAGILVYTTSVVHGPEIRVEGHAPRDTQAVAQRLINFMDQGVPMWLASGISAHFITTSSTLLSPLNHDELMEVFHHLEASGRLGELFNLVSVPRFRELLRQKEIPWEYVFQNWESTLNDRMAIIAGTMVGAGENFYQVIELIGMLIGSPFSAELAREREEFFHALGVFINHPVMTTEMGLRTLRDSFMEKLWSLELFDAGRIIGNVAVTILTLPAAIRSIPQLARNLGRLAVTVSRVTLSAIEQLGVLLEDLARFAMRPMATESFAMSGGYILTISGEDILLFSEGGQSSMRISRAEVLNAVREGRVALSEITDADVDRAFEALQTEVGEAARTATQDLSDAASASRVPLTIESLETVVQDAINALRETLGDTWTTNSEFGTRLHAIVRDLIMERFAGIDDLSVFAEQPMRSFGHIPPRVLNMTIEEFVQGSGALQQYANELRPLFTRVSEGRAIPRLVRDLKPDLVMRIGNDLTVWDLTTRSYPQHLAKTMLYAHILGEDGTIVRIGETYWLHFTRERPFVPRQLYPAAVEAAEAQRQRARARLQQHQRSERRRAQRQGRQ